MAETVALRALTIRQPWAWAITHAGKRIENRTWTTGYRGLLAIHAGSRGRWDPDGADFPLITRAWERHVAALAHPAPPFAQDLTLRRRTTFMPFGAIVAVAVLADVHDGAAEQASAPRGPSAGSTTGCLTT